MQKNTMDLSELFKSGFQSLHKQALEKNYKQKTLKDRMDDFSYIRRQTRDTLLLQKRNLDLNNMSPYVTPEPSRQKKALVTAESVKPKALNHQSKQKTVETKSSKRLEMLKKWKEDKEKRIQEEKMKAKPIFKVCHVTHDLSLPEPTKEKLAKCQEKFVSKFAPKDHIFRAPKNIKPVNIGGSEKLSGKHVTNQSQSRRMQSNKLSETRQKTQEIKLNRDKSVVTSSQSKSLRIPLSRNNDGLQKNQAPEVSKRNDNKRVQKIVTKTPDKTKKKTVDWNLSKKSDESESILKTSHSNPDKKKYPKTPRKRKIDKNSTNTEDGLAGPSENLKTPNRKKNTPRTKIEKKGNQLKLSENSGSEFETLNGSRGNTTEENQTCSERELVYVDSKHQAPAENAANTFDNSEANPQGQTEPNCTPKNNRKSLHKKEHSSPVNYISPFVTISRGKDSARKEFKVRQSTGGTFPESTEGRQAFSTGTSPKMGAEYFTKTLDKETDKIESICEEWERYKENEIPEEAVNLIDVAVGQSKLLISKKFKQFRSLIEECRSCQYKEKPITCADLHGFWDMVHMQVGDLEKRFANLESLKANDWKEVVTEKKVTVTKKPRGRPKKASATSSLRDVIRAARNKKKQEVDFVENPQIGTKSPLRGLSTVDLPSSLRRSLRVSLLSGQTEHNSKRASSSPGLTMMKVTQAIKTGDGITPSRSILKSNLNRSEKRITKSVLFKDDLEENIHVGKQLGGVLDEVDKENNARSLNSLILSPVTPTRRSQRLSKKSLAFKLTYS